MNAPFRPDPARDALAKLVRALARASEAEDAARRLAPRTADR